ncbi:MAG: hypothetical protein AAF799_10520 [Myxococcota bacterium]
MRGPDGIAASVWVFASTLALACTADNPRFEANDSASEPDASASASTTGVTPGDDEGMATDPVPPATEDDGTPGDGPGSDSGVDACFDPEEGVELLFDVDVEFRPMLCTGGIGASGLLERNGDYWLTPGGCESDGNPSIRLYFQPIGPVLSEGEARCVDFVFKVDEEDCSLTYVIIREAGEGPLIYVAATVAGSPLTDNIAVQATPLDGACDCAAGPELCCEPSTPAGPYGLALDIPPDGEQGVVEQGEVLPLSFGQATYEFSNLQSRVTNDCEDPLHFDWVLRRVD